MRKCVAPASAFGTSREWESGVWTGAQRILVDACGALEGIVGFLGAFWKCSLGWVEEGRRVKLPCLTVGRACRGAYVPRHMILATYVSEIVFVMIGTLCITSILVMLNLNQCPYTA